MKSKVFLICIIIFSLSVLSSCSDKKLDAEAQGVVNGILADKSFAKDGWTEKDAICWVKETKKLISDDEWKIMKIIYDPNIKGNYDLNKMLAILPHMYAAAGTCKVKLPA